MTACCAGINFAKTIPLATSNMKIRIKGNHLRFRLRQYDLATLCNSGSVIERIEFGETADEQISFSLQISNDEKMGIVYKNNRVHILIPKNVLDEWTNTEQVGIAADLATGMNRTVSVLIEKDFACLDATEEDNTGTYPNPLVNCAK
jgi:hypothetical protein